jgi:hypothetical protein
MRPEVAAALVGAGALSVLVYPFIAQLLLPKPQAAPGRDRQAAHL